MYLLNDDELKSSKIISSKLLFSFFIIFNNELIVGKEKKTMRTRSILEKSTYETPRVINLI